MTEKENAVAASNGDTSLMAIISRAASDSNVNVEKLQQLLDMNERVMAKQAEINFNQALSELQPDLPVIKHTAKITHSKNVIASYTKYEDLDKIIRPLYTKHGFSISFTSKTLEAVTVYSAKLAHRDGFSQMAEIALPNDTSGAKNAVQAIGSTISYAKRYLVTMLLNIVTEGEDDDAKMANSFITNEQAVEIDVLIRETKADRVKMFEYIGGYTDDVQQIHKSDYTKLMIMLKAKKIADERIAKDASK